MKKLSNKTIIITVATMLLVAVAVIVFLVIKNNSSNDEPKPDSNSNSSDISVDDNKDEKNLKDEIKTEEPTPIPEEIEEPSTEPFTNAVSDNCTIKFGKLMLINPNFQVDTDFIAARGTELISLSENYGIYEGNPYNGDNLLDAEAAGYLNSMNQAYAAEYPGHAFETRSCFRTRGLTCDLLDPDYGDSLDTSTYDQHIEWQWLRANSYKYGFIDRFPEAWAGGPMSEPANIDENGSTGLFETWHYRYVGVEAATEIATGKYNNGEYDSLEHYLKATGRISDLVNGVCN